MNLIGPFKQSTNRTCESVVIYIQIGDSTIETRRLDIKKTSNDQTKPDIVAFDIELDSNKTMPAQLNLSLQFTTNANDGVVFQMFIDCRSLDTTMGIICGGIILILLNVLIITEVRPSLDGLDKDEILTLAMTAII